MTLSTTTTTYPGLRLPSFDLTNSEPVEPTYRRLALLTKTLMPFLGSSEWHGLEKLPQQGGIICVANHISHFDPLTLGLALVYGGRWGRFLGKIQIFESPWLGWLARACGQIPVERGTLRAADSLRAAEVAVAEGRCVAMYPEGTLTGDPDGWPMTGRTGAARLALDTRAPVIPLAQWGAHEVMPARKKGFPLVLGRRRRFQVVCGDPVDLSDLYDRPITREVLELGTTRIMDAIAALLGELRGQEPPAQRWSFRTKQREPVVREVPSLGPGDEAADAAAAGAGTDRTGSAAPGAGPDQADRDGDATGAGGRVGPGPAPAEGAAGGDTEGA